MLVGGIFLATSFSAAKLTENLLKEVPPARSPADVATPFIDFFKINIYMYYIDFKSLDKAIAKHLTFDESTSEKKM